MRGDPLLRTANNTVLLLIQNFVPPVFPQAELWNNAVQTYMPSRLHERLAKDFEAGGAQWSLAQFQWEVNAGLGAGLSTLVLAGFLARRKRSGAHAATSDNNSARTGPPGPQATVVESSSATTQETGGLRFGSKVYRRIVLASIVVALLGYVASIGLSAVGRVTAPYYPLVIALCVLSGCHAVAVRRLWWRALAWLSLLGAFALLCITPPRPLWPAMTLLGRSDKAQPRLVTLARDTYEVNRLRPDALAPVRVALPSNAGKVGLITGDEPETSLWRPFGSRTVRHVLPSDTAADLMGQGIRYVVVSGPAFSQSFQMPFEQWLATMGAEVTATVPLTLKAVIGPRPWYVVRVGEAESGVK